MNRKQKTCLLVSIAAVVAMGLYPPWVIESRGITEPGPYSWIGNPPVRAAETKIVRHPAIVRDPSDSDYVWQMRKLGGADKVRYTTETIRGKATARFIDLYRLGVQYFMVAVVTAGLIGILKTPKRSK